MRYRGREMQSILWTLVLFGGLVGGASPEYLMGGHVDNNESPKPLLKEIESSPSLARTANLDDHDLDLEAEESTVALAASDDEELPRYRPSYSFAFNGGKPFSLEKDPITGKIDFEKAPPLKALNYTAHYDDDEEDAEEIRERILSKPGGISDLAKTKLENEDTSPNDINPYTPNFHDFLNLPIHYSSDKYRKEKYPLISSSYANTKVQSGSNSYSTYNHKPYHGEAVLYYPTKKPYVSKVASTTTATTNFNVKSMTSLRSSTTSTRPPTTRLTTPVPATTTTTTTTMRPTTTTTPSTTTTTTPVPTTTVPTSTKAPVITTWKPSTSTMRLYTNHEDDYEEILPIEKLQASVYPNNNPKPNNVLVHNPDTHLRPPLRADEYDDGYESYEMNDGPDSDYYGMNEKEDPKTSTTPAPSSTRVLNTSTISTSTKATTTTPTTVTSPQPSTVYSPSTAQENVLFGNLSPYHVSQPRPITSMPVDVISREPTAYDNVVDGRRPGVLDNDPINVGYRPSHITNTRPGIVGGGILVESTSNIVVPPDQDTVSFVLGNRQNVESGYYSLGTAIGESPYGETTGVDPSFHPLYGTASGSSETGNYDPQADRRDNVALPPAAGENNPNYPVENWWPSSSAANKKIGNEIEPSRTQNSVVTGTVLLEETDNRKEEKDANHVVFPNSEVTKYPVEEHIVVVNEADGSIHEIPPSSTTMKPRVDPPIGNTEGLPQLSENLTPPAERPRPPHQSPHQPPHQSPHQPPHQSSHQPPPHYYYHYHHGTMRPDYPRPQRLPLPPRGKLPPPPSSLPPQPDPLGGVRRRPYVSDSNLPNILPQFRPNAKTSHGHRGSETIGTIPAGQHYSTRIRQPLQPHPPPRRTMPPPPPYLQRLHPPPPPVHALRLAPAGSSKIENSVPGREPEPSVKRFRLPSAPASSRIDDGNKSSQALRLPPQKLRLEEDERPERYSEEPPQLPPRPPLFPKRRTADTPHVATLQMIQQRGEFREGDDPNGSEESKGIVTEQEAERRKSENGDGMGEPPVYVVYPVNTAVNIHPDDSGEEDESVVVGTRGPQRPLPPETLLHDNENHEMNDGDGPPMSNLFNNRPVLSDFPYPLERPDPSMLVSGVRETPLLVPSDQRQEESVLPARDSSKENDDKDTSVNVIPYLQDFVPFPPKKNDAAISATLRRSPSTPSSTPIAFAYTPTAQASHYINLDDKHEDISTIDRKDEQPVLLPSQLPSSSSSSVPTPQDFLAPFLASVSAESSNKDGWSVVVGEPSASKKSDGDRDKHDEDSNTEETQTEKNAFDAENFKPELFGGFRPLYEFPTEDVEDHERRDGELTSEISPRTSESATSSV